MEKTAPQSNEPFNPLFVGYTLGEYKMFFDLDMERLGGLRVLDCPAGPGSFAAEARAMGVEAVACDSAYGEEPGALNDMGRAGIEPYIAGLRDSAHLYNWKFYHYLEIVEEYRLLALRRFIDDYSLGFDEGRYIKASLPSLPFRDDSFDLALSSHFLFTCADCLDYAFHLDSLLELARVSKVEARVYPLRARDGKPCPYVDLLLRDLNESGVSAEVISIPFEFQKGTGRVLRLVK